MELSFEKAKELSIKKWKAILEGKDWRDNPELNYLLHGCGFCERYSIIMDDMDQYFDDINKDCSYCEFGKVAGICGEDDSLFDCWVYARAAF